MAIHSACHYESSSSMGHSSLRNINPNHTGPRYDETPASLPQNEEPSSPVKVLTTHSPFSHRVEPQLYLTESSKPIPSGAHAVMQTQDGRRVRGSIQMSEAHEPYGACPTLIPTIMQDSGKPERISRGCSVQLLENDGARAQSQGAFLRPSSSVGLYQPPRPPTPPVAPGFPMGPVEYMLSTGATSATGSFSSSRTPSPSTYSTSPSTSPVEMERMEELPLATSPDCYPKHNMGPPPPPEWAVDFHQSYIGTVTRRDRAGTGLCEHKQTQRIRFRNAIAAYQCGFCSLRWTVKAHKIKSIDYTRVTPNHASHYAKVVEARRHHPTTMGSCRCSSQI